MIYDKFNGFNSDLVDVGDHIDKAKKSFNTAQSKLTSGNGNLLSQIEKLKKLGAKVQIGHEPRLVKNANLVVASSAISKRNPELSYAKKSGLTIIPRAEMLGTLMKPYRSIAIAGSHGKTSTTSIVASIFNAANLSPTYVIGGQVLSVGRSSNLGEGNYIIVEASTII